MADHPLCWSRCSAQGPHLAPGMAASLVATLTRLDILYSRRILPCCTFVPETIIVYCWCGSGRKLDTLKYFSALERSAFVKYVGSWPFEELHFSWLWYQSKFYIWWYMNFRLLSGWLLSWCSQTMSSESHAQSAVTSFLTGKDLIFVMSDAVNRSACWQRSWCRKKFLLRLLIRLTAPTPFLAWG